jgi:hypothetical protein
VLGFPRVEVILGVDSVLGQVQVHDHILVRGRPGELAGVYPDRLLLDPVRRERDLPPLRIR